MEISRWMRASGDRAAAALGRPARVDVALIILRLGRKGLREDLGLAGEVHLGPCVEIKQ